MSWFAETKDRLQTYATDHRATWTPAKGSWYDKLYTDYHKRRRLPMSNQGRCEYFHRVIRQMLYLLIKPALVALIVVLLTALVWVTIVYTLSVLQVVAAALVALYGASGIMVALESREKLLGYGGYDGISWIDKSPKVAIPVLGLLFLPGFAVMWLLIGLWYGLVALVAWLCEIAWLQAVDQWLFKTPLVDRAGLRWLRPGPIALFIMWAILNVLAPPLLWVSLVLACIGLMAGVVVLLGMLAENREAKRRELGRQAAAAAVAARNAYIVNLLMRRLFAYQHPEHTHDGVVDPEKYDAWLIRYDAYYHNRYGRSYLDLDQYSIFEHVNRRKYQARFGELPYDTVYRLGEEYDGLVQPPLNLTAKQLQPSRARRFWRVVVEFFAFIGACIRTMKLMVCPVAEVSEDANTAW